MVFKILSVGIVFSAMGLLTDTAQAQWVNTYWTYGYGGCSYGYVAPAWQPPMSYQSAPTVATPSAPVVQGQTAQSGGQTYQSYSTEVPPTTSGPSSATYPVQGSPIYGGYNGYYGGPYYGGYGYSPDWRSSDNARLHGTNPSAYP